MTTRGVTFTPGLNSGAPSVGGVPLHALLPVVWLYGVAEAMAPPYNLTREDVLAACWFAARCGIDDDLGSVWKTRWGPWVRTYRHQMWHGDWHEVPDPPTPLASTNEAPQALDRYGMNLGMAILPEQYTETWDRYGVESPNWAQYTLAVHRHEKAFGRVAPAPTGDQEGEPVLAPVFVEWMMGLSKGWVTDVPGLSRAKQLKALGNGVVPAQAAAAVRHLLGKNNTTERGI